MHGPISAVLRQPAPRPPHRQHDGDAGVTHGRTLVERRAHRAPSEACPSHVVRVERDGRGGPVAWGDARVDSKVVAMIDSADAIFYDGGQSGAVLSLRRLLAVWHLWVASLL